jgi:hypothetical protein
MAGIGGEHCAHYTKSGPRRPGVIAIPAALA